MSKINIGLAGRISATIVLIIFLVALSIGFYSFKKMEVLLEEELKKRGADIAENMSRICARYILHEDVWNLYFIIKEAIDEEVVKGASVGKRGVIYAMVLDKKGAILAYSDPAKYRIGDNLERNTIDEAAIEAEGLLVQKVRLEGEGYIYDITYPVVLDEQKIGVVRVGLSRGYLKEEMARLKIEVLTITILLGIMGVVFGLILSRRVTKPLKRLTSGVEAIKEGNLDARIMIDYKGEIGRLAATFNKMAEDLKLKIAELNRTKDYLQSLLENANDIIFTLDRIGRITYINIKIEEWGYKRPDIIGRHYQYLVSERHKGRRFRDTIEMGATQVYDIEAVDIEGNIRYGTISTTPLKDPTGKNAGLLGIFRDTTEERRIREELEFSKHLSHLGELAGGVAHEVRNPLAKIIMGAYSLKEEIGDKGSDSLKYILKAAEELNRIVSDLLYYSGRMELHKQSADLNNLIEEILFNLKGDVEKNCIRVVRQYSRGLPKVEVDTVKMGQVFFNIMLNAVQAMPEGGYLTIVSKEIHSNNPALRGQESDLSIAIEFIDTGCGIPKENLKRIFNPFFSTKGDGTGLGLSLAHKITKAHGGRIEVQSEEGKGSIFRVFLPCHQEY